MSLPEVFRIAIKTLGDDASARACLADARACEERGDLDGAKRRALKSIAYSVGVLHPDYKRAAR